MKRKVVNVITPDKEDIQRNNRSRKVLIKIVSIIAALAMYSYLLSIPVSGNSLDKHINLEELSILNEEDLLNFLKERHRQVMMYVPQEYKFDELQEDNFNKLKRRRKTK